MDKSNVSSGIGFVGALTILFIALKLLGKINWSWWVVLSPLWIEIGLILIVLVVIAIIYLIKEVLDK